MKKIGREVGKIIPTSRKVYVEQSLASDKNFDPEYYDDTKYLMTPLLSSNKNGKSSDPESCSTGGNSRKTSISTFRCDICVESIPLEDSFAIKGCNHLYCRQCIVDLVLLKLRDNVKWIMCPEPDCRAVLDPEHCRQILPSRVIDRWVDDINDENLEGCVAITTIGDDTETHEFPENKPSSNSTATHSKEKYSEAILQHLNKAYRLAIKKPINFARSHELPGIKCSKAISQHLQGCVKKPTTNGNDEETHEFSEDDDYEAEDEGEDDPDQSSDFLMNLFENFHTCLETSMKFFDELINDC